MCIHKKTTNVYRRGKDARPGLRPPMKLLLTPLLLIEYTVLTVTLEGFPMFSNLSVTCLSYNETEEETLLVGGTSLDSCIAYAVSTLRYHKDVRECRVYTCGNEIPLVLVNRQMTYFSGCIPTNLSN
jgi:hypothetical protein